MIHCNLWNLGKSSKRLSNNPQCGLRMWDFASLRKGKLLKGMLPCAQTSLNFYFPVYYSYFCFLHNNLLVRSGKSMDEKRHKWGKHRGWNAPRRKFLGCPDTEPPPAYAPDTHKATLTRIGVSDNAL